jgi:hypothetical protein
MRMESEHWKSNTENIAFDNIFVQLQLPWLSSPQPCHEYSIEFSCGACPDSTIMSLPASVLSTDDTALSIPSAPYGPVAEWLRQVFSDFTDSNSFHKNFMPNNGISLRTPLKILQCPSIFTINHLYPNGGTFSQESRHGHQFSMSNFDRRLPAHAGMMQGGDSRFLVAPPRSRSPPTSSQSSHQGSEGHGGLALG